MILEVFTSEVGSSQQERATERRNSLIVNRQGERTNKSLLLDCWFKAIVPCFTGIVTHLNRRAVYV